MSKCQMAAVEGKGWLLLFQRRDCLTISVEVVPVETSSGLEGIHTVLDGIVDHE